MPLAGSSASCNKPTLVDYLADRDLMSYGQRCDFEDLTDRNRDRVNLLRFVAQHPEGVRLSNLVHWVLKGVRNDTYHGFHDLSGDALERHDDWLDKLHVDGETHALDGSDGDYQFARRYFYGLDADTDLVRLESVNEGAHGKWVFPTPSLLDLISAGITQTPSESDDLVYDRQFCRNMLKSTRSRLLKLSDSQKDHLASSLRRYIQRVEDYRLAFDVHMADRNGYQKRRMEKPFATRFNDSGRVDRQFARLQDSLEWGYDRADNAVFCTLTTDPKKFDSLWDAIMAINKNFNTLKQWMKGDPSTQLNTRRENVASWRPSLDGEVTGRPRENLEYVKVLEYTSAGYPHLHVLFFDVPTRDKDGMPWLCDKNELSHRWNKDRDSRPGQGAIVDCYPLVYRDDLDDLGDFGTQMMPDGDGGHEEVPVSEGFVSWYRYGDHDHDAEWVEDRVRWHKEDGRIDFDGDDENTREKTAGAYIGKYVSETYSKLRNLEELDDPDWAANATEAEKSTWWKLALYWVTNRRFWTPSKRIERDIELDSDRADVRRGVTDAVKTSLLHHAERLHEPDARDPDFDRERTEGVVHRTVRELVADVAVADGAPEESTTLCRVEYLGTYHWADMPADPTRRVQAETFEKAIADPDADIQLASTGDRPPPVADAWS